MRKHRIVALTLVFAMLGGLAGCGGQSSPTDGKNPDAGEQETPIGKAAVSAPGQLPITAEKSTLDVFIVQLPTLLTDVTTNTFTKELEEATNVHLNMTVAPEASYKEKLNLLLNSGDYPEVIMSGGFDNAQLVRYGFDEKMLIPLNDLIEEHGYNIKKYLEAYPLIKQDMTAPDGNIYGIPSVGSGAEVAKMTSGPRRAWINMNWLNAVGLEKPTTTEEFREVLRAFKTKDPNGNGKADEIPLTGAINTWAADPYIFLLNAFGYFDESTMLKLKDDKFTSVADQDYMKDGLQYIHELYDEGLLDPASLTQDLQQLGALGGNPDDVVGSATCGHVGMLISIQDTERARAFDNLEPLQGSNGYRGIPIDKEVRVSGAGYVITDRCRNPEIAFKFADYLCTEEVIVRGNVGIKGQTWDDADPGTFGLDGVTPALRKFLSFTVSSEGATANDIWENTCRLLETDWKSTFQVTGDIYDPTNFEARLEREHAKNLPYAADVQQIPPMYFDTDVAARINQLKAPLIDYVKTSIVEFIAGKKSLETDWESYKKGLDNLGYQEYIRLYQESYDKKIGK